MAEAQQFQELHDIECEGGTNSTGTTILGQRSSAVSPRPRNYYMKMRWLRIAIYTFFALSGSTTAVLLSRLYFEKGGKSKWVGSLVQVVGFPLLLPLYYCINNSVSPLKVMISTSTTTTPIPNSTTSTAAVINPKPPSLRTLLLVYLYLGLLIAGNSFLFSVGFQYLPVSIVTLVSASQLAFNAFFSYFLNAQKFTPFIVNSLLLLTVSSVLLVANNIVNSEKPAGVSKGEYAAGFICTFSGAAMNGLCFASQQLAFRKVLKRPTMTIKVVIDVIMYQSAVASVLIVVGLLASGEWRGLKEEMEGYEMGKTWYVVTLLWGAAAYQVFAFGGVALVYEVSALFSNVIGALVLPIVPIIAMLVFHDKMDVVKGISMVLAIWGFISYVYQDYLDEYN